MPTLALLPDIPAHDADLDLDLCRPTIFTLPSTRQRAYAPPTSNPSKRKYPPFTSWTTSPTPRNPPTHIDLHQTTCLNLNLAAPGSTPATDSDLWILPDFEEWECDAAPPADAEDSSTPDNDPCAHQPAKKPRTCAQAATPSATPTELTRLVKRAVNSNRERLRLRLEGDGWAFVGGKYGDASAMLSPRSEEPVHEGSVSGESVDEEFDVVLVLPVAACEA